MATGKKGRKNCEVIGTSRRPESSVMKPSLRMNGASAIEKAIRSRVPHSTHCKSFFCHVCVFSASIVSLGLKEKDMVVNSEASLALARMR